MADRINRDPTYDLTRHIGTGETGPLSGSEVRRPVDQELDRNDPMEDWTKPASIDTMTMSLSDGEVASINAQNATGLMSDSAQLDRQMVNMSWANRPTPNPGEGTDLSYGNPHTGSTDYRGED